MTIQTELDKMLTIKDVTTILDVHERSVRRYIADGNLPHIKVGKVLYFDRAELMDWIITHKADDGRYYL